MRTVTLLALLGAIGAMLILSATYNVESAGSTHHVSPDASMAGGGGTSVVLYCRLDLMPLQRLVGSERAARMLKDEKPSFLFC